MSASTTSATFKPKEPKLGGLVQTGDTIYSPWTGGKPQSDWKNLAKPPTDIVPTMYRPTGASSAQKSLAYRVKTLETKLSAGGNLQQFEEDVWHHFVTHGLDTITYLPDLADKSASPNMVSMIDNHSRWSPGGATVWLR